VPFAFAAAPGGPPALPPSVHDNRKMGYGGDETLVV
jgi:hypothetical protein